MAKAWLSHTQVMDDMGFVEGGLLTCKTKSMKDHHREMDGRKV
jgi:hypothetical protein